MYNYFMLIGFVQEIKLLESTGLAQIVVTLRVKDYFTQKEELFYIYFSAKEFKDILTDDLLETRLSVKGKLIMRNILELQGERIYTYKDGLF